MSGSSPQIVKTIAIWALKILVALAFLAAAAAKLLGAPMMVQEFGVIGLGQAFRYFTAIVEISGAVLVLIPKTSRYGGLVLVAVCIGAFVAQLTKLHGDLVHVFVLMALAGLVAWLGGAKRVGAA